ncbi:hypothetical protein M413DRAFT_444372 [Hebeloma cylindrosporum]|uniref:Uncharacterized protein n=1 Tax=Hebeloma cylindrosporum TaxID=76867 RepID=A0A0C2YNU9_HEBCY|nr:hypothetical protein M413DRAFT_444372 [Hebeloma cylindrosporum h7]
MDSEIISNLRLSESEQARLAALGSEITTPDEAKALANNAADVHEKLLWYAGWIWEQGFVEYSGYFEDYRFYFLIGLKKTYSAGVLGSGYFASFKGQVSDKWQEEPWEANKGYIANFLNDGRASTLTKKFDDIRLFFDDLPIFMEKTRLKIDNRDVIEKLLPAFDAATACTAQVDGFGKSWNTFYQDAKLIRDKTEIAVDTKTKTYLTERVKILGDLSKTLSEAMGIYSQTLDDRGVLDYPGLQLEEQ